MGCGSSTAHPTPIVPAAGATKGQPAKPGATAKVEPPARKAVPVQETPQPAAAPPTAATPNPPPQPQSSALQRTKTVMKKSKAPPCDADVTHTATLFCQDCEEHFCAPCDAAFHVRKKTKDHIRRQLKLADSPPAIPTGEVTRVPSIGLDAAGAQAAAVVRGKSIPTPAAASAAATPPAAEEKSSSSKPPAKLDPLTRSPGQPPGTLAPLRNAPQLSKKHSIVMNDAPAQQQQPASMQPAIPVASPPIQRRSSLAVPGQANSAAPPALVKRASVVSTTSSQQQPVGMMPSFYNPHADASTSSSTVLAPSSAQPPKRKVALVATEKEKSSGKYQRQGTIVQTKGQNITPQQPGINRVGTMVGPAVPQGKLLDSIPIEKLKALSGAQLNVIWAQYDTDGSGGLDRRELKLLASDCIARSLRMFEEEIRRQNPGISESDLKAAAEKERAFLLPGKTKEESHKEMVKMLVRTLDVNGDGNVSKAELMMQWNVFSRQIFTLKNEGALDCSIM